MGIENLDEVKSIVRAKKEIKDLLKTYYQMQFPDMPIPLMDVNICDKNVFVYIDGNLKLQKL